MHPELLLGGHSIHTHAAVLSLAGLVGAGLVLYRASIAERLPLGRVAGALLLIALAVLAGGRAHFVANAWSFGVYSREPIAILRFWEGLHAPGALVALAIATPLVLRSMRLPLGASLDALVPSACVGIALARLGCFANGCCFGRACEWAFCLPFPPGSPAQKLHVKRGLAALSEWSLTVHPFQLYLVAVGLGAAALGVWWRRRQRYAGQAALFSATSYLVGAGSAELFRENYYPPVYTWAGRLQFEWLGVGMAGLALLGLLFAEWVSHGRRRTQIRDAKRAIEGTGSRTAGGLARIPNGGS